MNFLQLCVWSTDNWENKKSRYIRSPSNGSTLVGDTLVQFHYDQTHLLIVHESQLAIYDGKLECLHSWSPRDALPSPISSAVYSSDGLMVYAGFRDGAIGIFEAESLGYNAGLHLLPTYLLQYLAVVETCIPLMLLRIPWILTSSQLAWAMVPFMCWSHWKTDQLARWPGQRGSKNMTVGWMAICALLGLWLQIQLSIQLVC